jgi:hypothetical protein
MAIVLFTPVRHNGFLHRSQYVVLISLAAILSANNQSFRPLYFYSRFYHLAIVSHRFIVRNCGNGLDFDRYAHIGYAQGHACIDSLASTNGQLMTVSAHVYVSSSLHTADCRLLYPFGLPLYRPRPHHSRSSALIALLLLISNVEPNPGPQRQSAINFGLMNVRSAVHKAALIHDVIRDHHLDLIAVTETWMFSDEPDAVARDIAPDGFRVLHACRGKSTDTHRGGGIAIIHRESIDLVTADIGRFCEFEHLSVKLRSSTAPSQITCIYRQPAAVSNAFCEDLSDLFEQLLLSGQRQVVCGDFNCPGKDGTQLDDRLQEVLSCYNQLQLVTQSTHQAGNLLDLVIVPDQAEEFVCDVSVHSLLFSDHSLVRCRLGVPPSRPSTVSYTYRNIKRIDLQSFRHGVRDSQLYDPDVLESFSTDAYTELFEAEISRVLIHVLHYACARNEEEITIVVFYPSKRAPRSARVVDSRDTSGGLRHYQINRSLCNQDQSHES